MQRPHLVGSTQHHHRRERKSKCDGRTQEKDGGGHAHACQLELHVVVVQVDPVHRDAEKTEAERQRRGHGHQPTDDRQPSRTSEPRWDQAGSPLRQRVQPCRCDARCQQKAANVFRRDLVIAHLLGFLHQAQRELAPVRGEASGNPVGRDGGCRRDLLVSAQRPYLS